MYINIILFFIFGLILSIFFNNIWYRLPIKKNLFEKSKCDNCNHELDYVEKIPIFSYIVQKGRCNYCRQKISKLYLIFEITLGISFSIIYIKYNTFVNPILNIILAIIFISSLLIIMFSDIKYMLIPDKLLIISSILVIIFKLLIEFNNEELSGFLDVGYTLLFMLIDAGIMFIIMYLIKKIADILFKKESLGGGDIKMMAYVSLLMGYKISIVIIFLSSFIALPYSIYNAWKKNEVMLPFGPFLSISTVILFLLGINFESILQFIH